MSHIAIRINQQKMAAIVDCPLVAKSVGVATFSVTADESWDGHGITIVFATAYTQKSCLYGGGKAEVPWEALDKPGKLWISAVGIAEGKRRPTAFMESPLEIIQNGKIDGGPPQDYSPALWEQVLARLDDVGTGGGGGSNAGAEAAQAKAEEAQKKAEAAQKAAEEAARVAAEEATKAAGEAGNATKFAGSATGSAEAAQDAQGKAKEAQGKAESAAADASTAAGLAAGSADAAAQSATSAGQSAANAEAAKDAAAAIKRAIPIPLPGDGDNGKVPVARDGFYSLEELAIGGGSSELEYIGEYTLAEDVATWEITSDSNGAPLQLKKMYFELEIKPAQINIDNNISNGHARMSVPTWANAYGVNVCVSDYTCLRKTAYKDNPGWGQLWEIQTLNGHDVVSRRSKGASCAATVSAGEAEGPGYITGLGLSSLEPNKAQFGTGSTVKIWGEKI